ncbi:ECF transporter S component [Mycetocola spongiae]|uniref:ECF transporter S component n=1 Tax=Mycetocola spongiae TaxID=2859226 RepID=UPI001CF443E9|nr:ECF transporter S component [Mycetocola spongiae]UCR89559.1 ECF transporter S component [Mycetocola spongiae]
MTDLSATIRTSSRFQPPWTISVPLIGKGVLGGVLYGLLGIFSYTLPGTEDITIRPAIAILVFLGIRFGPLVGGLAGLIGNPIVDLFQGDNVLVFWDWHLANALIGALAGVVAFYFREPEGPKVRAVRLAVISIISLVFGFALTFLDLLRGVGAYAWWSDAYLPAVGWSILVCVVLVPLLDSGWRPKSDAAPKAAAAKDAH